MKFTARILSFVVLSSVLTFGLGAFAPVYGCGGGQGGTSCREVVPAFDWLASVCAIVVTLEALTP